MENESPMAAIEVSPEMLSLVGRGPLPLFAACMTAMAIAASDSTTSAIWPAEVEGDSAIATRRSRASARAGRLEIESNDAARRLPPAPVGRAATTATSSPGSAAVVVMDGSSGICPGLLPGLKPVIGRKALAC